MITLTIRLIRFLFANFVGMSLLAAAGLIFIIGGAFILLREPENHPRVLTIADLETRNEAPRQGWLELTGGYLLWPEAKTLVIQQRRRGSDELTGEKTKTIYVPLVSKAVLDDWQRKDPAAPFSYNKIRTFVKMAPGELRKDFPQEASELDSGQVSLERLAAQHRITGLAGSLQREEKAAKEALASGGLNPEQIAVLRYGEKPPTKGTMIGTGIVAILMGLALVAPLALRLKRGRRELVPAGPRSGAAALAGFDRDFDKGLRAVVSKGTEAGLDRPAR